MGPWNGDLVSNAADDDPARDLDGSWHNRALRVHNKRKHPNRGGIPCVIQKDGDVESYTEASSPTPSGQENVTPLDMISGAVEEMVDSVEQALTGESPEKNAGE